MRTLQILRARLDSLSDRDRRALRVGALVLLPFLAWTAVVKPYLNVLEGLNDQVASEQGLLDRERAVLAEGPLLPAQLSSSKAALAQWDTRFIRSPNLALAEAEAAAVVESVAQASRVLLTEVRDMAPPPGTAAPASLQPIRMSVRGESDFQGVLEFLDGLEEDPLLFRIVGLSLDRPGAGSTPGRPDAPSNEAVVVGFVLILEVFAPAEATDEQM